jgi:hypothetical protein
MQAQKGLVVGFHASPWFSEQVCERALDPEVRCLLNLPWDSLPLTKARSRLSRKKLATRSHLSPFTVVGTETYVADSHGIQ